MSAKAIEDARRGGRSASSRCTTSSSAASSTATCGGCAPGTRAAATRSSARSPGGSRGSGPCGAARRPVRPRRGLASTSTRRSSTPRGTASASKHSVCTASSPAAPRPGPGLRRAGRAGARPRDRAAVQHAAKRAGLRCKSSDRRERPSAESRDQERPMAVTAAPARPATELRDRVVKRAEVVGVWAVDCVCAQRTNTDWAAELLGDVEHRHEHATLEGDGYHLDSFAVERVAPSAARPTCGSCAPSASAPPALPHARGAHAARDAGRADARPGPRQGDLRAADRRRDRPRDLAARRVTNSRTASRSPFTSLRRLWLPRSLTISRSGASGGIPNGSLSPWTISTGTVTPSSSGRRVFSGRPGGCSGNARQSTPAAPTRAPSGRRRARPTSGRRPAAAGRRAGAARHTAIQAASSCARRRGRLAPGDAVGLLDEVHGHAARAFAVCVAACRSGAPTPPPAPWPSTSTVGRRRPGAGGRAPGRAACRSRARAEA